jgi:protein-disulfide isomerase
MTISDAVRSLKTPLAALLVLLGVTSAAGATPALGERSDGRADAPVTVIAFHSMTCPACAKFKRETWPELKARYVDTGRIRVVWRDFPLDRVALQWAKLARCVGEDRYSAYMQLVYQRQPELLRGQDPVDGAARLARLAGLSEDDSRACLADKAVEDSVLNDALEGQRRNVRSTPTFAVGERIYPGELHMDAFERILDPLLRQSSPPATR